jgi:beta-lactamase superfamily II metal-dependent hydrolase
MAFEIDFLQAGSSNGDAICIRYDSSPGRFKVQVVDGGFADTGDRIIDHLDTCFQPRTNHKLNIADVVLSHMDNDHAGGLLKVLKYYPVANLWMNRPWLYVGGVIDAFHGSYTDTGLIRRIRDMNPNLVALEELAIARGIPIWSAFQGTRIGPFTVLAPRISRYMSLIPDMDRTPQPYKTPALTNALFGVPVPTAFSNALAGGLLSASRETWGIETLSGTPEPTSASNESSIVQLANIEGHRILLTSDAGPNALHEAVDYAVINNLSGALNLVQVPHHGSRHNVTPSVLDRLLGERVNDPSIVRGWAVASVGRDKDDYPRRSVANAFLRRGYPVFTTHDGAFGYWTGSMERPGWFAPTSRPFSNSVED